MEKPSGRSDAPLAAWLKTPLGTMLAAGRDGGLECLLFVDSGPGTARAAARELLGPEFELGENPALASIREELARYFAGGLRRFATPISLSGTSFQKRVWRELTGIPFGETISYRELAGRSASPRACRAAGQANARNRLPIIVPCHRVIGADGGLGGFSAGLERKKWLLDFEKRHSAGAKG